MTPLMQNLFLLNQKERLTQGNGGCFSLCLRCFAFTDYGGGGHEGWVVQYVAISVLVPVIDEM